MRGLANAVMASILSWKRHEIAIDFGTANVRVIRRDEGIVFDEPSLCCFSRQHGMTGVVTAGAEAHAMLDRTPTNLQIKRPLCRGVLQDIDAAKGLLRYALSRAEGRSRRRVPSAIIGVPADATQAERSAMLTAANDAGLGNVTLVAEPLAAAIGADLPVADPAGSMVIECGAGTTEVAVFSLGGICETGSVRIGGATLDRAIADQLHLHHKFLIGDLTAEQLKFDYVAKRRALTCDASDTITVRGRCLLARLPKAIDVEVSELDRVVKKHVEQIVRVVRDVLGRTPPELSEDIHDRGVVLTGGGALMPLMRTMIADASGLHVDLDEYREKLMGGSIERAGPDGTLAIKQMRCFLEAAMEGLPQDFRLVFVMHEVEEMTIEEIGQALDIVPATVETRLFRARRRLRQALAPDLQASLIGVFPFAGVDCEALTEKVITKLCGGVDPTA